MDIRLSTLGWEPLLQRALGNYLQIQISELKGPRRQNNIYLSTAESLHCWDHKSCAMLTQGSHSTACFQRQSCGRVASCNSFRCQNQHKGSFILPNSSCLGQRESTRRTQLVQVRLQSCEREDIDSLARTAILIVSSINLKTSAKGAEVFRCSLWVHFSFWYSIRYTLTASDQHNGMHVIQ